jgi:hypothetical protein
MTSDHRVAGFEPAGCMPYPEALMSYALNARNFACALLVLFYDPDGDVLVIPFNPKRAQRSLDALRWD